MALPSSLQQAYTASQTQKLDTYTGQRLRGAPTSLSDTWANGLEFDYKLNGAAEAAFLTGARFFLELQDYTGAEMAFYAFPYDPRAVSYDRPTAATFTHTINGGYIREFSSSKTHFINIEGETGLAQRLVVNRRGELVYADGQRAMLELDEFLKRYHEFNNSITGEKLFVSRSEALDKVARTRRKFKTDPGLTMIFHSLDDQASFVVEPVGFSYGRESGRYRHSYTYNLQLKAFDYYTIDYSKFSPFGVSRFFDGIDSALNSAAFFAAFASRALEGFDNEFIGPLRGSIANVGNIANEYNRTLNTLDNTIANVIRIGSDVAHAVDEYKKLWNNLTSISSLFDSTIRAVDDVSTTWDNTLEARDIVFTPSDEAVLSARPEEDTPEVQQQQQQLRAFKNDIEANPDLLNDLVASGLINEFINGTARGVAFIEAEAFFTAFFSTAELRYISELMKQYIDKGYHNPYSRSFRHKGQYLANDENVRDFANNSEFSNVKIGGDQDASIRTVPFVMREGHNLGDVARIVLGDSAAWPTLQDLNNWVSIDRNHLNNLPSGGDIVKVPVSAVAESSNNPFLNLDREDGLVGTDLKMVGNDLVFTQDDVGLASGEENIKQLIVHTVLTNKGEIPGFEIFGTPDYVGSAIANEELSLDYVNLSIRQALLADPRILDLYDVAINLDGTRIDFSCSVVPLIGESSKVIIPIR